MDKRRYNRLKKKSNILIYLALSVLVCIFIFPVIWVVLSSIKDSTELYSWPPKFIPDNPTFENFIAAFEKGNFGTYFLNSTFVTVTATVLTLIINTMAGYALAKYRFKGDTWLLIGFISTLMIPLEVIMTPIFSVISKLGLYNSLWGIIIPPAATPTGVFLIRQYLLTVPDELIEAARIDGAGEWKIFWKLIVPIAKPIISVLAIFSFMWRWDDFIWPLIVISDPTKYTVQLALSNFIGEFNVDWGSLLAMSVVTMIPVLIVFLIFQKQFIQGMATSGMKD
ncbi:carbohydrate ABC transporter permease [Paenibacillus sp. BSR1-1]|uniref:carbohydrate ABC transporter permease n=1 Tax=Paenibacillus sp. BSR1-1 TaxID=3020845 RepID=UPI0025B224EF|nr:carbohydrate ABC transporter permease [Paenibacillus sp. BSR1-1]MDN3019100.1 carbohydrate ABC transporter permease [Paenibacillus sp. BSR1-1]